MHSFFLYYKDIRCSEVCLILYHVLNDKWYAKKQSLSEYEHHMCVAFCRQIIDFQVALHLLSTYPLGTAVRHHAMD